MKKKNISITILALSILAILTVSFFMGSGDAVPLSEEELNEDLALDVDLDTLKERDPAEEKEEQEKETIEEAAVEVDKAIEEKIVTNKDSKENERAEEKTPKETKQEENQPVTESPKQEKPPQTEKKQEQQKNNEKIEEERKELEKQQKAEKEQIIAEDNKNKDKKDKYQTDPVPEGKPKPVEWQDAKIEKDKQLTATLSVSAKTILNNMHLFNQDKLEVLPADGVIYPKQTVTFYEGESVFDILHREMKNNKIHMEFVMTPIYNSHYIEGINNLYEFDCGELSGWMYKVNGWFPNYGASRYQVKENDVIDWVYTCDLGRDIGGGSGAIGGS